ncbi:MAG TPA: DinB family protein, partial [Bryobacteraceae bacterium]|nr:DinB family protein [Bryobacteraceae bacterium]
MTPEKAAAVAEFLIPMLASEYQTTRKVLAALPDDKADYRPAEKNMTAGSLAAHIAQVDVWFLECILNGGEFTMDPPVPAPAPS